MSVAHVPRDNITMVAFLGDKTDWSDFMRIVNETKKKICEEINALEMPKNFFVPYTDEQIHATILGMEVFKKTDGKLYNVNFFNNNNALKIIQPPCLLSLMDTTNKARGQKPYFTIRFGGFPKAYCNCKGGDLLNWNCRTGGSELHSFNKSAYQGSFYGSSGDPAVLTGWPVESSNNVATFNRNLFNLRQEASKCGFLDKYHSQGKPDEKNDDFFVRLGTFKPVTELSPPTFDMLLERIRDFRRLQGPETIKVPINAISIVYYDNPSLDTIREVIPLPDAIANPKLVDDLYERWKNNH